MKSARAPISVGFWLGLFAALVGLALLLAPRRPRSSVWPAELASASHMRKIAVALEAYQTRHGTLPPTLGELVPDFVPLQSARLFLPPKGPMSLPMLADRARFTKPQVNDPRPPAAPPEFASLREFLARLKADGAYVYLGGPGRLPAVVMRERFDLWPDPFAFVSLMDSNLNVRSCSKHELRLLLGALPGSTP